MTDWNVLVSVLGLGGDSVLATPPLLGPLLCNSNDFISSWAQALFLGTHLVQLDRKKSLCRRKLEHTYLGWQVENLQAGSRCLAGQMDALFEEEQNGTLICLDSGNGRGWGAPGPLPKIVHDVHSFFLPLWDDNIELKARLQVSK
eukprot:637336-Pelagomonas_calceolata.AAC.1